MLIDIKEDSEDGKKQDISGNEIDAKDLPVLEQVASPVLGAPVPRSHKHFKKSELKPLDEQ